MLDPSQWDQLRGLTLASRALVTGTRPGGHAAARIGVGGEFHDYRPYVPGDDLSRLDWKVFGRSDRYYVRRHRHETDLTVHVLVDASASMDFAGLDAQGRSLAHAAAVTKLRYALDVALALAFVAVRQADRAGAGVYDDELRAHVPPGATWPHVHRMRETLESVKPSSRPADTGAALTALHRLAPGRALVVVISDFLDEPTGFFDGADRWRHAGAEIAALTVLTPTELSLDHLARPVRLIDPETGEGVSTHGPTIARSYRRQLAAHLDRLRRGCAARGVGHHLLRTDEPVPAALRRVLG